MTTTTLVPLHVQWLKAGGRAETTLHGRERLLRHANDHLPYGVDDANSDELAAYLAYDGWSTWTRHTYDTHLRRFFDWAYDHQYRDDNPMWDLLRTPEGDRLPDPCTSDELVHMLTSAPRWWQTVFLLAAYAGLRASEIGALLRQDVTEVRIRVRNGKGGKDAYVDTHPLIWEAVKDLPKGRVVRDATGEPVTGYQLTNRGWEMFRRIGQPTMHLHRLRHWYATALLEAGADLETVRQCMRHSSITSTVNYTLIASAARRVAVHRLPAVQMEHEPVSTRLVPQTDTAA